MNINDFIPSFREASFKKIYKDFPGWEEVLLPVENVVDFYGRPTTLSVTRLPRIGANCFDGVGVIRCDLDGDVRKTGKYPFLALNWEQIIKKWLGTTAVKENAKAKIKYAVHFPPQVKKPICAAEEMGYKQVKAKYVHNYFANPKYDIICSSSNIRTDHIYVKPTENVQKPMFVEDIEKPRKMFHNYITGKDEYREIGLISDALTKTYIANKHFEPIDIVKDNSKERARDLMRKYTAYLDKMSTQTKTIMAKPYKREDK